MRPLGPGRLLLGLRKKSWGDWAFTVLLIAIGLFAGRQLGDHDVWIRIRYAIYQELLRSAPREAPRPKRTSLVVIEDEEYWKGELARRVPIKRSYLARLIRILDAANPSLIALDFDLRSPAHGALVEHPDYVAETADLLTAVNDIARNRPVVLPRTVGLDDELNYYAELAIFDGSSFSSDAIREGYISLPHDLRLIPMPLRLKTGALLDSFATAVVRAVDSKALGAAVSTDADSLPYGSYITPDAFKDFTLSASEVLNSSPSMLNEKLSHRIVLVSGVWRRYAYRRGPLIDSYLTPVGTIPGVLIHANYVEALLDSRTYKSLAEGVELTIELVLLIAVVAIFSADLRARDKAIWIGLLCGLLVLLTYFMWQNLGMFFDFFVPAVALAAKAMVEQVWEWRSDARKYNVGRRDHGNVADTAVVSDSRRPPSSPADSESKFEGHGDAKRAAPEAAARKTAAPETAQKAADQP